jgi:tRNA1(Val) A37 N6-methylase TrmN6
MGAERDPMATNQNDVCQDAVSQDAVSQDAVSQDAVLGGRLQLRQPKRGHRVGHDAILLAAASGGRAGEMAVDLGSGVGAAGLALAARVPGLNVTLVEIDEALCALAADNARLNGLVSRVQTILADAENPAAIGLPSGAAERVLMNPPFNDPYRHNVPSDPGRRLAYVGGPAMLARWVATAAWLLKPQGVLTLIWRAEGLPDVLSALAKEFGAIGVLPVLPRVGSPAIRVLVRAMKGAQASQMDYPGLVLNDAQGQPSAATEAVLRGGEMLVLAEL